jgi:hypothetical protein
LERITQEGSASKYCKSYSDCILNCKQISIIEETPMLAQICRSKDSKPTVDQICKPGPLKILELNESSKFNEVTIVPQRYWDLLYDLACNAAKMDASD